MWADPKELVSDSGIPLRRAPLHFVRSIPALSSSDFSLLRVDLPAGRSAQSYSSEKLFCLENSKKYPNNADFDCRHSRVHRYFTVPADFYPNARDCAGPFAISADHEVCTVSLQK